MPFTHIHTHSIYSVRDGMLKVDDIINFYKKNNEAIALTDHGSIGGWLEYYNKAKQNNLKPILGVEIYLNQYAKELLDTVSTLENQQLSAEERKILAQKRDTLRQHTHHLVLLAKNEIGFYNIIKLLNIAYTDLFYSKPLLDYVNLFSVGKNNGLIVTTACLASPLSAFKTEQEAIEFITIMKEYFGDDFYLEVQSNAIKEQREFNKKIIALAQKTNTKMILGTDAHYSLLEDAEIHQDLLLLQNKKTREDLNKIDYRITYENKKGEIKSKKLSPESLLYGVKVTDIKKGDVINNVTITNVEEVPRVFTYSSNLLYLKSESELRKEISIHHKELLPYINTIMNSNNEIYDKISDIQINTDLKLPYIPNATQILINLVKQKMKTLRLIQKKYIDRAKYELEIIKRFNFETYFLILHDLIQFAKKNNIGIGAGRGSASGSFIAYLLDIHRINPFDPRWDTEKNGLPFERFLDLNKLFAKIIVSTKNNQLEFLENQEITIYRNTTPLTIQAINIQVGDIIDDVNESVIDIKIVYPEKSYPDIDLDFSPDGRQKIIDYLVQKYGEDQVALVGTQLIYSSKSVLRDLGQVYAIPANETQRCTKEYNDALTVAENKELNPKIKKFFNTYPQLENKVDKLNGVISALGIHAGGVVITDKKYPLKKYCALQRSKDGGRIATLWTKEELQPLGMIKYDILGLTTAGQNHIIKQMVGMDPYTDIEYDDSSVYEDIVLNNKHKNIFQFETHLGKQAFKDLKPLNFMELANASGIIRVLATEEGRDVYNTYAQYVHHIHLNNHNYWKEQLRKEIYEDYNYEVCVKILADSYGVLIYQEQLANLVKEISKGKKTFADGNQMRKELEKFSNKYGKLQKRQGNPEALKEWHSEFMKIMDKYLMPYLGKDGYDTPDKDLKNFLNFKLTKDNILLTPKTGIIKWILTASSYLFNKLHAIAYTVNTYNAMYLKHYYPLEFWCGSLRYEYNDLNKIKTYIAAIQLETNIDVLSPNINKSDFYFTIENKNIRYGLGSILNVGESAHIIVKERKLHGIYTSIDNLFQRVNKKYLNKRVIEALLYTNALSDFGTIAEVYEKLLKYVKLSPLLTTEKDLSLTETKYIGIALSYIHPLIKQARAYCPITKLEKNERDMVAVQIMDIKHKTTKNNKPYALFKCQCINSYEIFNVFDWGNNHVGFKKNTIEVMYIQNNGNIYNLIMSPTYKNKSFIVDKDTVKKIKQCN